MIAPLAKRSRPSLWKSRWLSLILVGGDVAGFVLCWFGAYWLRAALNPILGAINDPSPYLTVMPLIVGTGVLNCAAFGLYVHRRKFSSLNRPSILLRVGYHWLLYIIVVAFVFKELDLGRTVIIFSALFGLIHLFGSRTLLKVLKGKAFKSGRGTVRSAIVGGGTLAIDVKESLRSHPEIGFTLLGLVLHREEALAPEIAGRLRENEIEILGTTEDIASIVEEYQIEELFLAMGHLDPNDQFALLHTADIRGLSVHAVSDIFGVLTDQAKVDEIATFPVITLRDGHMPLHQRVMKRALDIACGLAGVAAWLLFFHWWISWRIRRESPGSVFFRQQRVGKDGQIFTLYKYRTMRTDAEPYAIAPTAEDDPRVTPFGRWLRKTSLDELPQLWNVLEGKMSMVGPRPEMPFLVERYEPWQRRRLDVKPGLTGLWQVVGRKNLPLHLNMQYDLYYIKNQNFLLDVEILFKTIPAVLKGRGAF